MNETFLNFATDVARAIGRIHLAYFRGSQLNIVTKSNASDVVTRADKESEELFAREVQSVFPHHKIQGEEGGFRGPEQSDYLWVVDPLDGTTNYSQGLPIFSVSIGLQYRGQTILGVVYAPYLDELYYATLGSGAFLKKGADEAQKIHVAAKTALNISVIGTGFPYDKGTNPENNTQNVTRIAPQVRDLRRMGSAAYDLCAVASGTLDGYWEMSLNLWDVCAGCLIVQEAGGAIYNYRDDRNISIIAGNSTIVDILKGYVK